MLAIEREAILNQGTAMRSITAFVILSALVPAISSAQELVKCKRADGSLYVGPTPPENCIRVGSLRETHDSGSSWHSGDFKPTPTAAPDTTAADLAAQKQADIAAKRAMPALAIQNMVIKPYRNGHFFEGTVANGAAFPVYGGRICADHGTHCQPLAPSTVQPGATATFSFEIIGWEAPDYQITWDVVPPEE